MRGGPRSAELRGEAQRLAVALHESEGAGALDDVHLRVTWQQLGDPAGVGGRVDVVAIAAPECDRHVDRREVDVPGMREAGHNCDSVSTRSPYMPADRARERILDAARRLLAQRPFAELTVGTLMHVDDAARRDAASPSAWSARSCPRELIEGLLRGAPDAPPAARAALHALWDRLLT